MKHFYSLLMITATLFAGFVFNANAQKVYYVANSGTWDNWDIYSYDIGSGVETRLTFNPAIDNHPEISHSDTNRVVFSSNRGNGEFDLYVANVNDIDNTAVRVTFDDHPGIPQMGKYPDRHPEWHPNGELVIFTSKNRAVLVPDTVVSECSQPAIIHIFGGIRYRYYEGMNIIKIDAAGNVLSYTPLNMVSAWDQVNQPGIWVNSEAVYVGHPSFSHDGNKIVFSAAIDGEGKNWEVYTVGFDPVSISLIPNSLRRITFGPNPVNNPIKMSGGASFTNDDSEILFASSRITNGNSQIYSVPATGMNVPVSSATRITFDAGNDYVPEPMENGAIMITSDLGPIPLCNCVRDSVTGPTDDLDVVMVDGSSRTILGTDGFQETMLLSDEVSWFCGLKPNLSSCTFYPKIMPVQSLWLEHNNYLLPPYLLKGYGDPYSSNARDLYETGWFNLHTYMENWAPDQLSQLFQDMSILGNNFPGWDNTSMLEYWLIQMDSLATKKYVVPAIMHGVGLGDSCLYTGVNDPKGEDLSESPYDLIQNHPNPFLDFTTIDYEFKEKGFVEIKVYDMFGKEIAILVNEEKPAGKYSVTFNSNNLTGAIYYYSMRINNSFLVKKMVLLK